jgi:hypothetical protein
MWTKENFLEVAPSAATNGEPVYVVYVESKGGITKDATPGKPGGTIKAKASVLLKDGIRAFAVCFDADQKTQAGKYADSCRSNRDLKNVDDPRLVRIPRLMNE